MTGIELWGGLTILAGLLALTLLACVFVYIPPRAGATPAGRAG